MSPPSSDAPRRGCGIDLWVLPIRSPLETEMQRRCIEIMPLQERRSIERYKDAARQAQALAARALLRRALSHRLGLPAPEWRFEAAPRGRLRLAAAQNPRRADFSLAHTEACVVCAIAEGARVGVDVEAIARLPDLRAVARTFLAPREYEAVAAMTPQEAETAMIRLWTLKEALAKGVGAGMALAFETIRFDVARLSPGVEIECLSAANWRFRTWDVGTTHAIALAFRTRDPAPVIALRAAAHPLFGVSASE
ncbi:MAG: 4'-phosphopantetheinyl transferase superfamily protein [Alphaproteobacteria bacterium]|nr:4'-phosphopantetheinyl transferase superfamily protein [Alphaproteobacteria bacterium]